MLIRFYNLCQLSGMWVTVYFIRMEPMILFIRICLENYTRLESFFSYKLLTRKSLSLNIKWANRRERKHGRFLFIENIYEIWWSVGQFIRILLKTIPFSWNPPELWLLEHCPKTEGTILKKFIRKWIMWNWSHGYREEKYVARNTIFIIRNKP